MKWYYVEKGKSVGPLEEAHLQVLVKTGQLNARTMVYSERLTGWAPYARAFAEPPSTGNTAATEAASPGVAEDRPLAAQGRQRDVVAGITVGAGIVLTLVVLLSVRGLQISRGPGSYEPSTPATVSDSSGRLDYGRSRGEAGRQGGGAPIANAGGPVALTPNPGSGLTAVRSRGEAPGTSGRGTFPMSTSTQVSRSSILGRGLRKDDVDRILVGKTRREIVLLLGFPDAENAGGMLWRYTSGVQIYDPGPGLTYFTVEMAFERSPQPRPGPTVVHVYPQASSKGSSSPMQQLEDTVKRLVLVSAPRPQPGQIR
jgi:hypothetical protein